MKRRRAQRVLEAELKGDHENMPPPPPVAQTNFQALKAKMANVLDSTMGSSYSGKSKSEREEESKKFSKIGIWVKCLEGKVMLKMTYYLF